MPASFWRFLLLSMSAALHAHLTQAGISWPKHFDSAVYTATRIDILIWSTIERTLLQPGLVPWLLLQEDGKMEQCPAAQIGANKMHVHAGTHQHAIALHAGDQGKIRFGLLPAKSVALPADQRQRHRSTESRSPEASAPNFYYAPCLGSFHCSLSPT